MVSTKEIPPIFNNNIYPKRNIIYLFLIFIRRIEINLKLITCGAWHLLRVGHPRLEL